MFTSIPEILGQARKLLEGSAKVHVNTSKDLPKASKHAKEIAVCDDGTYWVSDGTEWKSVAALGEIPK